MKRQLGLVVLAVLFVAADDPPAMELPTMEGAWDLVTLEKDGMVQANAARDFGIKIIFKGNTIAYKSKDGAAAQGMFVIDAKKNEIDTTMKDKTAMKDTIERGIYAFEGPNTLKLCVAATGGERPKEFKTKNGDGVLIFTLKREPAKEKPKEMDKP